MGRLREGRMSNKRGVSAVRRGCLVLQEPLNSQYISEFLPKGQTAGAIYPLAFILCCLRTASGHQQICFSEQHSLQVHWYQSFIKGHFSKAGSGKAGIGSGALAYYECRLVQNSLSLWVNSATGWGVCYRGPATSAPGSSPYPWDITNLLF